MKDEIQAGLIKIKKRLWRRRRAAWLAGPLVWLAGAAPVCAESPPAPDAVISSERQAADPAESLPELGGAPDDAAREKQWAEMAKQFGEKDLNNVSRQQMRSRAEDYLLGQAADTLQQQAQELLSPLGTARLSLKMTGEGDFTGSNGQLFSPLYDVDGLLTYSQIGWLQQSAGALGNFALGQRWIVGDWLLGYNTALDSDFARQRNRGSVGAEAWGDYLRFSTNYYYPLSALAQQPGDGVFFSRPARGYDITTQGYLPFYRQIGGSLSYEQYLGDNVDLFGSGKKQNDPRAMQLGLNYTPVPLVTMKALHKIGAGGQSQDQVELALSYRLGVPLAKQISPEYVAQAKSLRGSRYDPIERKNVPVLEFRQRKTLQVFLATPPWSLQAGETVPLVLEIKALNGIAHVSWQGDTQALSLTPPHNANDPQGWTAIVPPWDDAPGAANSYRLSVTLEDEKQQRVTSNWIELKVAPPLTATAGDDVGLLPIKTLTPPPIPAQTGPLYGGD
ncbi:YchO/YchP family invasin [Serratia marcescens]|uniref:YchO/YchP family invasin n=1 Tax=Serratia TaxID=613 RepID=UPI001866E206|nr:MULTISPECIES: YchO/YchP family invasin [Serratia]MBH2853914.1 YchO/YchP family invasin [Serratia marcescens]MDB6447776.1 YchO/YchP family invasin [Serratia sp. 21NM0010]